MADDWTQSFFTGVWLDVQRSFWTPDDSEKQAGIVERALALRPGSRVLDMPCGTGRLTIALARRGHTLTGVDFTPEFLADARAAAGGLPITFIQRDMRQLAGAGLSGFDAVFNFWGSFGYFDEAGNQAVAAGACQALAPGGRFLIECHLMETLLPAFQPRGWSKVGPTYMLEERTFDPSTARIEVDWTFLRAGEPERRQHMSMRLYSGHELAALLRRAGFAEVRFIDAVTEAPLGIGARRALAVATK